MGSKENGASLRGRDTRKGLKDKAGLMGESQAKETGNT